MENKKEMGIDLNDIKREIFYLKKHARKNHKEYFGGFTKTLLVKSDYGLTVRVYFNIKTDGDQKEVFRSSII